MSRPLNKPHTAETIRAMAERLRESAKSLDELAEKYRTEVLPGMAVQVAHHVTIEEGIRAVESMRLEILKKMNEDKFVVDTTSHKPKRSGGKAIGGKMPPH